MAIDFPTSPTVGQQYTYQGATYVFSAQGVWVQVSGGTTNIGLNVLQRVITSNTTYVPSIGLIAAIIECVGGGAGGGGSTSDVGQHMTGGGGGSGAFSRARLTAAQIGAGLAIVIGAAGTGGVGNNSGTNGTATTVGGTLITAPGGVGGFFSQISTATQIGQGGAGGAVGTVPSSDDLAVPGMPGGHGGFQSGGGAVASGQGGSSRYGGGGVGVWAPNSATTGPAGGKYGSGGAGGSVGNAPLASTGGAGSAGVCIITEYIAASSSGGGGGSVSTTFGPPQGRLTLQTGVPVMTTTQAAKTTIFYTPYKGNQIPIWNGTAYVMTAFTELSVLTTDTAKSPAAIGVSKVNDWFVWSDAGTLRIGHGPDWTNDTTRSAGTALTMVQGILVNSVAITNGPGIGLGTYVGTTRSNGSSQLDWIFGGTLVAGFHGVWNAYNRVRVGSSVTDNTSTWTYGGTAYRSRNAASTTTAHIDVVIGGLTSEDAVTAEAFGYGQSDGVGNIPVNGIALDVVTSIVGGQAQSAGGINSTGFMTANWKGVLPIGYHIIYAVEAANNAGSPTWFGGSASAPVRVFAMLEVTAFM